MRTYLNLKYVRIYARMYMKQESIYSMAFSITKLRANLYKVIDRVIKTGVPVEIDRNGHQLQISIKDKVNRLSNLNPHPGTIVGDPEDIVSIDWSIYWNEAKNL